MKKRARPCTPPPASPSEPGPILSLLLAHNDRQLRLYVLSFCWLSLGALRRSCKALYALLDPERLPRTWWRHGVRERVGWICSTQHWHPDVARVFCARLDPFYDAWPPDIPARYTAATPQQMLAWMWPKKTDGPFLIICERPGRRALLVSNAWTITIRDAAFRHRWTFSWTPATEEWRVTHGWLNGDGSDWRPLGGSIEHVSTVSRSEPDTWFSARFASRSGQMAETFWMHRRVVDPSDCQDFPDRVGQRYAGYCTPDGPLDGVHKWL